MGLGVGLEVGLAVRSDMGLEVGLEVRLRVAFISGSFALAWQNLYLALSIAR